MKLIIAILVVMWLYSYYRYSQQRKYYRRVSRYYEMQHRQDPEDPVIAMGLASAYMKTQQYHKAYQLYDKLLAKGVDKYPRLGESIRPNMAFCQKPMPGCNGPKDLNGSWWHEFRLKRLGAPRRYDFTEEHMLAAESMMRQGLI